MSLARAARDLPLALIAALRPEVNRKWLAELEQLPHAQSFLLSGLRNGEARAFLTTYLGSPDLAEELEPELTRRSDGNPFLLLELLRGLEARGQITRLPNRRFTRSRMASSIAEVPLPESVSSSIRARASRLSRLGRDVLEMASCAGAAFDPLNVGSALCIPALMLLAELAALEHDGWVVPTSTSGYAFGSHHFREAVYSGLPATLRQANHLALAEAQERDLAQAAANASVSGSAAVELCTNFLRSGMTARARPYLEPALEHLTARYDRRAVLEVVGDALAGEASWSDSERIALLLRQASHLAMIGRPEAATESFATALLLAEGTDDRALRVRVRIELGNHLLAVGRIPAARAIMGQAVGLAESEEDPALLARALVRAGQTAQRLGKYTEAVAECERALELAVATSDNGVACSAAKILGDVHDTTGHHPIARDFYQQGLKIARESAPSLEAYLANGLGTSLMNLGDWDGAEHNYRRQIALAQKAGDAMTEGLGAGSLARMFLRLGRSAEAGRLWERQLLLARRYGNRRAEIAALGNLSMVKVDQGFLEAGRQLALDAAAIANAIGAPVYEQLMSLLIGVAIYGGDRDRAREMLARPSMAVDRLERGQIMRHSWTALIAEHEENSAAAVQAYELAVSHARASGSRWQLSRTLLMLGQVLALEHKEQARSHFEEARSIAGEIGSRGLAVIAQAYLAGLPGGDLAAAEAAFQAGKEHLSTISRMEVSFHLRRLTHRRSYLDEAHRTLIHLRDHAPAEYRESILTAVPIYRQIRAAWTQEVA
jgi:tetratricopeptide (TPR) repeat protein